MEPIAVTALLSVLAVVVVTLLLIRMHTLFVLRIRNGQAVLLRGKAPPGFVDACNDICRLYRIERGEIRGVRGAGTVQLRFSNDIPERARQPFRNVWTPPPSGGGGGGMRASR